MVRRAAPVRHDAGATQPHRVNPSITGAYGGHTIDFRRFAADGITLTGRIVAARDGVLDIAPGLAKSLADGDAYYMTFLDMLDAHVERHGLNLPTTPPRGRCWPTRLASPRRCGASTSPRRASAR